MDWMDTMRWIKWIRCDGLDWIGWKPLGLVHLFFLTFFFFGVQLDWIGLDAILSHTCISPSIFNSLFEVLDS